MGQRPTRARTQVDDIADSYFDASMVLDPVEATTAGVRGYDHQLTDHSPAADAERGQLAQNLHSGRVEPGLLSGLPEGTVHERGVLGVLAAAGEGDLARMRA